MIPGNLPGSGEARGQADAPRGSGVELPEPRRWIVDRHSWDREPVVTVERISGAEIYSPIQGRNTLNNKSAETRKRGVVRQIDRIRRRPIGSPERALIVRKV